MELHHPNRSLILYNTYATQISMSDASAPKPLAIQGDRHLTLHETHQEPSMYHEIPRDMKFDP